MARDTLNNHSLAFSKQDTHHTDFFHSVHQAFECAVGSQAGLIDYFFSIAGYTIHLRFAGPTLVPKITPAFTHLASPPTQSPALTVCICDSASTGVPVPTPPWSWKSYATRMDMRVLCEGNGHIHTSFHPAAQALNLLDVDASLGIFWVRDADRLPYYETGAPLRLILNWWLNRQGKHFAHAAAVGYESGGVLLVGQGGSGKSTSSLTCLNSTLPFMSDDYCVFGNSPVPYVHSIYSTAKLERHMLPRLPYLAPAMYESHDPTQEKAMFFLWEHFSQNMIKGFPIRALLVPRITASPKTTLRRISPVKAIRALAPSTTVQLPGVDRTTWEAVIDLAKHVPTYELELSSNLSEIPEVLSRFLEKINSASGMVASGEGK